MGSSGTLVGSKLEVLLDNIGVALLQPSPTYPLPVTHESRLRTRYSTRIRVLNAVWVLWCKREAAREICDTRCHGAKLKPNSMSAVFCKAALQRQISFSKKNNQHTWIELSSSSPSDAGFLAFSLAFARAINASLSAPTLAPWSSHPCALACMSLWCQVLQACRLSY